MWPARGAKRPGEEKEEEAPPTIVGNLANKQGNERETAADWAKRWEYQQGEPSEAEKRIWICENESFAVWRYRKNTPIEKRGGGNGSKNE